MVFLRIISVYFILFLFASDVDNTRLTKTLDGRICFISTWVLRLEDVSMYRSSHASLTIQTISHVVLSVTKFSISVYFIL
jgi:hypothetical protein